MATILQQLNADMAAAIRLARRSLVQINNGRRGIGSGVILHSDGLIVTNAHVVHRQHRRLTVTLPDGRDFSARVLAEEASKDLAALSIPASDLPVAELGDSRSLEPGEWVLAVGFPWGVAGAATSGAVIDVGESVEGMLRGELVQVGFHLRPGHSGGPLVDSTGRLVGINTMINGPDVGLAVPVHAVKAFLKSALGSQRAAEQPVTPSVIVV